MLFRWLVSWTRDRCGAVPSIACGLSLLLCLTTACQKQPNNAAPNAKSTAEKTLELAVEQTASSHATDAPPSRTPQAAQPITGLPIGATNAELDRETSRVDPQVDGWSTAAFNENALAQLKSLAKWMEHNNDFPPNNHFPNNHFPNNHFPDNVFSDELSVTELRPKTLAVAFDESNIKVQRWQYVEQQTDQVTVTSLSNRLRQLLPGNEQVHAEFKIIGIDATDETTKATVRVHLSGANSKFRFQQNAAWMCAWEDAGSDQPKIKSIELLEFEEVQTSPQKLFADRTAAVFQNEPSFEQQLLYPLDYWRDRLDWRFGWLVVGAHGLAVGDANGDGLDDVYYAETGGLPNRLLIQQPDGTVRDVAKSAGVDIIEPTQAALFVDLDNDGDQDLLASVSRFLIVFENDGQGHFTRHPIVQTTSLLRSIVAVDYDNDRLLDVYTCGYSLRSPGDSVGLGRPLPYHDANNGGASYLMRNAGSFRFEDVTKSVGLDENNRRFSYAAAWEDFDNDGDADLYVANDFGRNCLYRNDNGNFKNIAAEAGVEDIAAGMSVSWGDFNLDGQPDLYISNMFSSAGNRIAYQRQFRQDIDEDTRAMYQRHARGNTLFQNMGDGTFRDVSQNAGVTEARWAWSSNFADINNDGWQDILVGNGMVTGTHGSGDL